MDPKRHENRRTQKHTSSANVASWPLVSLVTVCRNSEKTISKTIESVLDQSYPVIEYIIVDGASNDRTIEVIKKYELKFKGRLHWISEQDRGIYHAMNKGVSIARGDIVGLINSDDWYEPDAVRTVAESYRKYGEAIYYGIARIMENGQEVMLKAVSQNYLHRDVLAHPAYFVPKSLYQKLGDFRLEFKYAADYELILRYVVAKVPFVRIEKILASYVQGGESARHGLQTLEELFKVRHLHGFISKRSMVYQIAKYRILYRLRSLGLGV